MDAQDSYMNDMGGMSNGMDIMNLMQQTNDQMAQTIDQMNSPLNDDEEPANGFLPKLEPAETTKMCDEENSFTGRPVNYKSPIPDASPATNNITINLAPASYGDVTINLGKSNINSRASTAEPYMDDDFDEFDAKDDLTKDQQKQDANVTLARRIDQELNRVADEVMNIDEIEQQYRMTKDPNNPKNIFVLKFGKNEEQHWRLPWNPTTNLMCHMEPNKLLIEQSKYNALYIKTSITPQEYKKQAIIAKKKAMLAKKEANKKYKVNIGTPVLEPIDEKNKKKKKPQTTKFSDDLSNNKSINALALALPTSNGNSLMVSSAMGNKPRGTFLVNNSMLIHSEETVSHAKPTDQQQLIAQTQLNHLHIKPPTESSQLSVGSNVSLTTPVTAQIAPELLAASGKKPVKKPKHQRRVSLTSVGDEEEEEEWNNHEEDYSESDSDDDDYYNDEEDDTYVNKKRVSSKLNSIQLSVSVGKKEDHSVQRLDDLPSHETERSDFGRSAYEQEIADQKQQQNNNLLQPSKGKLGIEKHIGRASTVDIDEWSPPKMTLEKWNAVDVWQGILYLGDEWDALNYMEIMDNNIEYFINCAAGYCAFEYEKKLKYFWLENWRRKRDSEREKQKIKTGIEREKRRKNRLKKFKREHPNWRPRNKTLLLTNMSTLSNNKNISELPEMVQFAMKVQPNDSPIPRLDGDGSNDNKFPGGGSIKKVKFRVPKSSDIAGEFEIFKQEREEYAIIEALHNEILDLEVDDSDHSSMYDSCLSSDEYGYDSDEFDEYLTMSDEEIIAKLCPFKFLNIYAHNWEGYRLLDLHMNDVWNFIEQIRMKNMNLTKEWKIQCENGMDEEIVPPKPPKVSCLIFCTKNNIPMTRLNSEIVNDEKNNRGIDLSQIGHSICTITDTYKNAQEIQEDNIWNKQIENYQTYLDNITKEEEKKENNYIKLTNKQKLKIKNDLVSDIKRKNDKLTLQHRYTYKYWTLDNSTFWNDFELLKTRDDPLNRLFGSSSDRSSALVLGFMIHSGIRLKQSYKALLLNKANTLRNQSFLRQLIQLDWMKHCFAKPGMKQQVPFRDEYQPYDLDTYLIKKKHYDLK